MSELGNSICVMRVSIATAMYSFLLLVLPSTSLESAAAPLTMVFPPEAAESEGDVNLTGTGGPGDVQYLFLADEFADLPETHRLITKWNFRGDASQPRSIEWTFPNFEIWLSTTSQESLSGNWNANVGPDRTLVFAGTYTYSILGSRPPEGPRAFGDSTPFQKPFFYDPSQGNLLIEVLAPNAGTPRPGPNLDFMTTPAKRVATRSGTFAMAGVSQLTFVPIPEPAGLLLAAAGLLWCGGRRWVV